MDSAVSLVQTYLRINGYFTVTEFPVVESISGAEYQMATDLDLLASRFPAASRRVVHGDPGHGESLSALDPILEVSDDTVDMIVGEVKESVAEFNPSGLRRDVLAAVLARFGCCRPGTHAEAVVDELVSRGLATTTEGHLVRLVAFGAKTGAAGPYLQVGLDRVIEFVEGYVRRNWTVLRHTESKDPTLSFLMLREKAKRGGQREGEGSEGV